MYPGQPSTNHDALGLGWNQAVPRSKIYYSVLCEAIVFQAMSCPEGLHFTNGIWFHLDWRITVTLNFAVHINATTCPAPTTRHRLTNDVFPKVNRLTTSQIYQSSLRPYEPMDILKSQYENQTWELIKHTRFKKKKKSNGSHQPAVWPPGVHIKGPAGREHPTVPGIQLGFTLLLLSSSWTAFHLSTIWWFIETQPIPLSLRLPQSHSSRGQLNLTSGTT